MQPHVDRDAALPSVVVFIPALDEEDRIGDVIAGIRERYDDAAGNGYVTTIIVVDDGSTDATRRVSLEAGAERVVTHPYNQGLGAATRSGMQAAAEMGADIAVKIDADFQHDPADVDLVVKPILEDQADAVFGSRMAGEIRYRMPFHRQWGNRFFSWLVSVLTGLKVTDAQTGLMAFNWRYLKVFEIVANYNETQQLIMDAWAKHFRVMEVPVVFHERTTGKSFISFKYPFKVLPTILRMLVRGSPLKVFVPIGAFLILLGSVAGVLVALDTWKFGGDTTAAVLIIAGVQAMLFGLLADSLIRR
jgi:glycosyltransferase involved in cell wall biosynthesis